MITLKYTIKDNLGIHARPAGALVKEVSKFKSTIKLTKGDKTADLKKLFSLMGLNVKFNDEIKITIDGEDEKEAYESIENFLKNNL